MNRAMTGAYGELYTGRYLRDNGYSIVRLTTVADSAKLT